MAKQVLDLAVFGSPPIFQKPLHVGRPNAGDPADFLGRAAAILESKWFTNHGPCVEQLEQELAKRLDVKHCVAVCNGTLGLEIAIRATGLRGEVIVPSFTFVATAHALESQGIHPVFCDIDPETHNLDPVQAEALVGANTTGIIGVHLWGRPCAIEALENIARTHRLTLMFDAAHAFHCSRDGKMIGNFGLAEVFSFHATKLFNTFEGGAVATNDAGLAKKLRLMRNFGFAGYDRVVSAGTNAKMPEVCAAMGLCNLAKLGDFISTNRRNYRLYLENLEGIAGLRVLRYNEADKCNYQYIVIELDPAQTLISRDHLIRILHAENILARRYFYPGCHRMEPYASSQASVSERLPHTERVADRVVVLPTGFAVGRDDIEKICNLIRFVTSNGRELTRRLSVVSQ